jgi:hypothetical protein
MQAVCASKSTWKAGDTILRYAVGFSALFLPFAGCSGGERSSKFDVSGCWASPRGDTIRIAKDRLTIYSKSNQISARLSYSIDKISKTLGTKPSIVFSIDKDGRFEAENSESEATFIRVFEDVRPKLIVSDLFSGRTVEFYRTNCQPKAESLDRGGRENKSPLFRALMRAGISGLVSVN